MDLSFIIVNYFTAGLINKLVLSIRKHISNYTYQILIGDNSNDIEQEKTLRSLTNSFTDVFILNENIGFVAANNLLVSKAQGKVIILLNPDALLINNSLEKMVSYLLEDQSIGVIGPFLLNEDGTYQVSFQNFAKISTLIKEHILLYRKDPYTEMKNINYMHETDIVKGACLAIRKSLLDEIYLFDPELVMYSEEVDLCLRIKKRGKKVIYFPETKIVHLGGKSSSQPQINEYALYHYFRSKIILFEKHYSVNYAKIVKIILCLSLLEKSVLLFMLGKKKSSQIHWNIYIRIIKEFCSDHKKNM